MNTKEWDAAQDKFWLSRLEAKAAYKKWQESPDDIRLADAYSKAWQAYQEANMSLFLIECENEK